MLLREDKVLFIGLSQLSPSAATKLHKYMLRLESIKHCNGQNVNSPIWCGSPHIEFHQHVDPTKWLLKILFEHVFFYYQILGFNVQFLNQNGLLFRQLQD